MSDDAKPFRKRFPNMKVPVFSRRCGSMLLTLTFVKNDAGDLVVRGFDPVSDRTYDTLPVLPEDWRSFGFGKLSSLKAKHKDILYGRILNGLDVVDDELRLTWVWVVKARAMREKKAKAEYDGALILQCLVRCHNARFAVRTKRDQKRAATSLQSQVRRLIAVKRTSEKRTVFRSTLLLQSCARRLRAKVMTRTIKTNKKAAVRIQTRVRAQSAQKNFGTYKATTLAARLLQRAVRCHQAFSKLAQIKYENKQNEKRVHEERERAAQRAKEMAEQFARDRAELIAHEKKQAHLAWEKKKAKIAKARKQKLQQEEEQKRLKEERVKQERENNILLYRKRIAAREKGKKRKLKRLQRMLDKQARERGENPASTILTKLAMAIGKPLDTSYYERALVRKKRPKVRKDPLSTSPMRYAYEIEASLRHMKRDMKIKVKKKSPKPASGMKGPPSANVRAFDQQKFFLSKKERKVLSQIDNSPCKPTSLLPQI